MDHFSVLVEALRLEPASSPFREEIARQALDAARPVADDIEQVASVVERLASSLQPSELGRLLPVVKRIRNETVRAEGSSALVTLAPPDLTLKALEVARQIQEPGPRSEALAACLTRSPEDAQSAIFEECVGAASRSTYPVDAFTTLAILLPRDFALKLEELLPPEATDDAGLYRVLDALRDRLVEEDDPASIVRAVTVYSTSLPRAAVDRPAEIGVQRPSKPLSGWLRAVVASCLPRSSTSRRF